MNRRIVLVSGSPASGKSTLATPLALELGFPLLGKDDIKETLHDVLGSGDADITWSRQLGSAAMEVLWTMAEFRPLDIGPLIAIDTTRPVDVPAVAAAVKTAFTTR